MPRFELGRVVVTQGCLRWSTENSVSLHQLLLRHSIGDWGDLEEEDKQANENALETGARILSAYVFGDQKIYVVTEWNRSATTILLAEEY